VGACGYILSCLALNGLTTRGSWFWGHLPGTDNPQARLLGNWVCAESELKEELDQADRW
jgi:hypothetical protein